MATKKKLGVAPLRGAVKKKAKKTTKKGRVVKEVKTTKKGLQKAAKRSLKERLELSSDTFFDRQERGPEFFDGFTAQSWLRDAKTTPTENRMEVQEAYQEAVDDDPDWDFLFNSKIAVKPSLWQRFKDWWFGTPSGWY